MTDLHICMNRNISYLQACLHMIWIHIHTCTRTNGNMALTQKCSWPYLFLVSIVGNTLYINDAQSVLTLHLLSWLWHYQGWQFPANWHFTLTWETIWFGLLDRSHAQLLPEVTSVKLHWELDLNSEQSNFKSRVVILLQFFLIPEYHSSKTVCMYNSSKTMYVYQDNLITCLLHYYSCYWFIYNIYCKKSLSFSMNSNYFELLI